MKKILIFLVLLALPRMLVCQFKWVNPFPQGNAIRCISFAGNGSATGIASGEHGTMLRTTDKGVTWNSCFTGTVNVITKCVMTSESTGYAINANILMKTTDGGKSWFKMATGNFIDIDFQSDSTGFTISDNELFSTSNGGSTWERKQQFSSETKLFNISFLNDKVGYIAGERQFFYKTTDGGNTVQKIKSDLSVSLLSVVNEDILYSAATFRKDAILKSTDGGKNWASCCYLYDYVGAGINDICIPADNKGVVVGPRGLVMPVSDGVEMFNTVLIPGLEFDINCVTSIDSNTYFAGCQGGQIIKSTNGGYDWQRKIYTGNFDLYDACSPDNCIVYAVGDSGTVLKSVDSGQTWTDMKSRITEDLRAAWFLTPDHGFVAGGPTKDIFGTGKLYATTDGGVTWSKVVPNEFNGNMFWNMKFLDSSTGFLAGDNVLYKTSDGGRSWNAILNYAGKENAEFKELFIRDENLIFIYDGNGNMLRTTDGGKKWLPNNFDNREVIGYKYIYYKDSLIYAFTRNAIYTSSDEGNSWMMIADYGLPSGAVKILNVDTVLYALSAYGSKILKAGISDALALNWEVEDNITLNPFNNLFQLDSNRILLIGSQGALIQYEMNYVPLVAVTTGEISDITGNSAKVGGSVNYPVNEEIWAKGIIWSEKNTPTYDLNASGRSAEGSARGDYSSLIDNLEKNKKYYVRAYAISGKDIFYGETKSFSTQAIGVKDDDIDTGLQVFPNPVADNLNIICKGLEAKAGLKIVDMQGRVIIERKQNAGNILSNCSLPLGGLAPGVYVLIIENGGRSMIRKIIKI